MNENGRESPVTIYLSISRSPMTDQNFRTNRFRPLFPTSLHKRVCSSLAWYNFCLFQQ